MTFLSSIYIAELSTNCPSVPELLKLALHRPSNANVLSSTQNCKSKSLPDSIYSMRMSLIELILATLIQTNGIFSSGCGLVRFIGFNFKNIPILSVSPLGTQAIYKDIIPLRQEPCILQKKLSYILPLIFSLCL